MKQSNNHIVFKAPANVVSKEMQKAINALLNADTYVCLTSEGDENTIFCKSKNLLLDCVEVIGRRDKQFLDELTNIVIDLQNQ